MDASDEKHIPNQSLDVAQDNESCSGEPGLVEDERVLNYFDVGGVLEDASEYRKGGFHPVHIGDILNGRFEVVHKLGSGGYGIAWLCLDKTLNKWRAVKVMAADHSMKGKDQLVLQHLRSKASVETLLENHIAAPVEEFWVTGPNGKHLCFVMPFLGCDVGTWRWGLDWREEEPGTLSKRICHQIAKSLGFLHRHGVCHGDFRPSNILMQLKDIDGLEKHEVYNLLGKPRRTKIDQSNLASSGTFPKYSVVPIEPETLRAFAIPIVAVVDFGESFLSDTPTESCGIPIRYAAPEVLFNTSISKASDVWALVCTLFEIRTRQNLFDPDVWDGGMTGLMSALEFLLDDLPEPYKTIWFEKGYDKEEWMDEECCESDTHSEEAACEEANESDDVSRYVRKGKRQ